MSDEPCRADARRQQVLDAATACFRRNGFHRTSMAELSKAAGMSVGHIYHYFENKEAIIAAIVAFNMQHKMEVSREIELLSRGSDMFSAMVEYIDKTLIDEVLDDPNSALMLEVVAEGARNEKIAAIVRAESEHRRNWSRELLLAAYRTRGTEVDATLIDGQVNMIDAMFEGLTLQVIRNPDLDREALTRAARAALKGILSVQ